MVKPALSFVTWYWSPWAELNTSQQHFNYRYLAHWWETRYKNWWGFVYFIQVLNWTKTKISSSVIPTIWIIAILDEETNWDIVFDTSRRLVVQWLAMGWVFYVPNYVWKDSPLWGDFIIWNLVNQYYWIGRKLVSKHYGNDFSFHKDNHLPTNRFFGKS